MPADLPPPMPDYGVDWRVQRGYWPGRHDCTRPAIAPKSGMPDIESRWREGMRRLGALEETSPAMIGRTRDALLALRARNPLLGFPGDSIIRGELVFFGPGRELGMCPQRDPQCHGDVIICEWVDGTRPSGHALVVCSCGLAQETEC